MICKRCNSELPENSRFCLTCGALQPMICPSCQAESRPGSRICSGCGKKLPVSGDSKVKFYKKKRTPIEIVAMVLLVLGALLVLVAAGMWCYETIVDVSEPNAPVEEQEQTEQTGEQTEDEQAEKLEIELLPPEPKPEKEPEEDSVETSGEVEDEQTGEELPEDEQPEDEQPEDEQPEDEQTEDEQTTEEQPTEEEPAQEQTPSADEWVIADSNTRLLTAADIEGLSKWELEIAVNEIFARHGRIFNRADLKAHFNSCSWYAGTIPGGQFDQQMTQLLSETETKNAQFLRSVINSMG